MNVVNLEKAGDDGERADGDDHQHGGAGPAKQGWKIYQQILSRFVSRHTCLVTKFSRVRFYEL